MKITCTNNGTFNSIQVGSEYEVVEQNDWSYTIQNDRGIISRYAKKYFKEVVIEPPKPVEPEFNPENIDIEESHSDGENVYKINVDGKIKIKLLSTTVTGNCGILFLYGINEIFAITSDVLDSMGKKDIVNKTIKNILNEVLKYLEDRYGLVCFSSTDDYKDFWPLMENLKFQNSSTSEIENPNSGNLIKLWSYYVYTGNSEEDEE